MNDMKKQPDYDKIYAARDVIDRLQIWIRHEINPLGYPSGTVTFKDLAEMLLKAER